MAKYTTVDGIEVEAELVQGRTETKQVENEDGTTSDVEVTHHDFWEVTFPDGTVKEVIDTNPANGDKVFASNFKEK